ncbi:MAG: serine/threonine-protein kinase [Gemmatimonadota bacterium]
MNDGSGQPGAPPPANRHDLVGTVLAGRYRIVRRLGEGAMGAVYVGEHLRIGRLDAIKVLRGGLASDADSISRFNRGARNLSAIRHPNVCTLYDYGETEDGSPFLALELIDGESLKEIIDREGALPVPRALAIARQIAAALEAAHHAGIVHRDLKPGNVMIERGRDGSDIVKVVDFDIAKGPAASAGDEVTELGFVVGTPEYMSPEQLMGERLDGRSDLYSLGLVLFRMLSGALPFRGGTTQEIMLQRLTAEPLPLGQIRAELAGTPGLQPVLDRSLAREKDNRYADAADFGADLDRLRAGQPPAAPAAAASRPVGREMPETVVASHTSRPVAAPSGGPWKRGWVIGAIAVLGITAAGVPLALKARGGGEPGPGPIPVDSGMMRTDSSHNVTPPDTQTRRDEPPPIRDDTTTPTPTPEPPRPQPQPPGGDIPADSAAATDMLFRLQGYIPTTGERLATPVAEAVRDSANRIFALADAVPTVRARAAYVIAQVFFNLHDADGCESWIARAIDLAPGNRAFPVYRESCRSLRL